MELNAEGMHDWLDQATDAMLDSLDFGVIGLDEQGMTCRYSDHESKMSGLHQDEVLNRHFFDEIGRCMNNVLVAKRLDYAQEKHEALDVTIDYVLAFRSKKTDVKIRMLYSKDSPVRYVLIHRLG